MFRKKQKEPQNKLIEYSQGDIDAGYAAYCRIKKCNGVAVIGETVGDSIIEDCDSGIILKAGGNAEINYSRDFASIGLASYIPIGGSAHIGYSGGKASIFGSNLDATIERAEKEANIFYSGRNARVGKCDGEVYFAKIGGNAILGEAKKLKINEATNINGSLTIKGKVDSVDIWSYNHIGEILFDEHADVPKELIDLANYVEFLGDKKGE